MINLSVLKRLVKAITPPVIYSGLQRMRKSDISFRGDYPCWNLAERDSGGYGQREILQKVIFATVEVIEGRAAYERDSVTFDTLEYSWPLLSGLLLAAAQEKGKLSVLDFGGALGSSFFQYRDLLGKVSDLSWSVIEQPHYVAAAARHIDVDGLKFYDSLADCCAENRPNVILLSSVLQYIEDPFFILDQLFEVNCRYLIIDRTPFSNLNSDSIVVQEVPEFIYKASYPMHVFSYAAFLDALSTRWSVVANFECPEGAVRSREGLYFSFKGLLLEKLDD